MTTTEDYVHPASGRTYREGDPAHRFARLAAALARQCAALATDYEQQVEGLDYLQQHARWQGAMGSAARVLGHTIAELDKAYTAVVVDQGTEWYGLGRQDEEWHRKYGDVSPSPER